MTSASLRFVAALIGGGLLTACGDNAPVASGPIEIARDAYCSLDGMTIADYPGPKAQIHHAQGDPEIFCDTVEMFSIYLT